MRQLEYDQLAVIVTGEIDSWTYPLRGAVHRRGLRANHIEVRINILAK